MKFIKKGDESSNQHYLSFHNVNASNKKEIQIKNQIQARFCQFREGQNLINKFIRFLILFVNNQ